jgi:hypothetical protein
MLKVTTRAGAFTDSLNEGDIVRAEVQSSEKGTVVMKSEDGQVFKARLDADVTLSPGDKALLEVTGKEAGVVYLSIREEAAASETDRQSALVRDFEDKSLAPFAAKLAGMNMTVTEETARAMRELMAKYPGLPIDEAAFIAANKLTGDENLVKAALSLLSEGTKTNALINQLITLLNQPEPDELQVASKQQEQPTAPHSSPLAPNPSLSTAPPAPLTDFLTHILQSLSGETEARGQAVQTDYRIISQHANVLQTRIAQNVEKNSQIIATEVEKPEYKHQNTLNPPASADESKDTIFRSKAEPPTPHPTNPAPDAFDTASKAPTPRPTQNSQLFTLNLPTLLSEIPQFRTAPPAALERFSDMLLRTACDVMETKGGDSEKLAALLEKLFASVGKSEQKTAEHLKNTKEELFARLSLIEEAIIRAAPPAKTELLDQMRKLMDHVRLLNSIDQFVYMQLPVTINGERKSAELYLFRRKGGGKRLDPNNVNILLALDLENMGHWEGLINIRNKDVSIRMQVPSVAEKDYFSKNTVLLHTLLSESGFRLVSADIAYGEEETTPLTALSVLGRGANSRIDYVV